MPVELPDHDDIANVFVELAALYPPSELHGFYVGQQVLGAKISRADRKYVSHDQNSWCYNQG